jgi:Zn-dependent protease
MRPQYYYDPPRSNWTNRLKEPPWNYLLIGLGIALAIYMVFALPQYGARILILLIAFPIHELAHAITAYRLGDPTPKYDGRLTLNPFAHLDFFGSLLIMIAGLGWAKPVRFNPSAFRMDPRTGAMIVAAAGPLSNLALAVILAMLWRAVSPILPLGFDLQQNNFISLFLTFVQINIALFFFNLIPLAPLDGFMVLKGLLPYQLAYQLERIQPYSFIIFLILFLLPLPILGWLIIGPTRAVMNLLF